MPEGKCVKLYGKLGKKSSLNKLEARVAQLVSVSARPSVREVPSSIPGDDITSLFSSVALTSFKYP